MSMFPLWLAVVYRNFSTRDVAKSLFVRWTKGGEERARHILFNQTFHIRNSYPEFTDGDCPDSTGQLPYFNLLGLRSDLSLRRVGESQFGLTNDR